MIHQFNSNTFDFGFIFIIDVKNSVTVLSSCIISFIRFRSVFDDTVFVRKSSQQQ